MNVKAQQLTFLITSRCSLNNAHICTNTLACMATQRKEWDLAVYKYALHQVSKFDYALFTMIDHLKCLFYLKQLLVPYANTGDASLT